MDKIMEKAVVTVVGKDAVGILAKVSNACAEANANVIDVSQSVLTEIFCMIMVIDISELSIPLDELKKNIEAEATGMTIHVMHENIFNAMHRI
ncbi:MAG: ACT domain-containing protein [[Eubacterium] sulci]|jgi:ACT domain protein|nr:ACT domain-containing protein [[Eubacterium] sulci]